MSKSSNFSPFIRQCFVSAAVGLNTIAYGCVLGFPAILLPQLKKPDSPIQLTKESESWTAAVLAISLFAGNFIAPIIMDRLGRKAANLTATVLYLVSWYLTVLADNIEVIIIGRTVQGIASGILTTLRSVLIGEYTSPKNRGAFLTMLALTQAIGVLLVHLVGSFLSWQRTALICVFFPFLSLLIIIFSPESPSWLVTKGRYDECRKAFRWLRGSEEDDEVEELIKARMAFERAAMSDKENGNRLSRLWTTIQKREFYKPITILISSQAILQICGTCSLATYPTVILEILMGPSVNIYFWMVFLDAQRLVLNIFAVFIINRTKRRTMVFSTGALSVLSHIAIAVYVYLKSPGHGDSIWIPALLLSLQVLSIAVGTVPMPQVIGGEVLPLEYRGIGSTISLSVGAGFMFFVLKTFPKLVDKAGLHGAYTLYAGIILVNLIIIAMLLPETKGKTLQQIEDEFRGRPLRLEEIEARQSLQSNPLEIYKRKMSERRCSSPVFL